MNILRYFLFYIIIILSPNIVSASDLKEEFRLKYYGKILYSERTPNAIYIFDQIKIGDVFDFRASLRENNISIVVLNSPGGSVYEALQLSGIIHDKKLRVLIPKYAACESACSFLFFGGSQRVSLGKLGVHQFYSSDDKKSSKQTDSIGAAQYTASEIIAFLNEYKTPPFVFEKMFSTKGMYYFPEEELAKLETKNAEITQTEINDIDKFLNDLTEKVREIAEVNKKNECKKDPKACTDVAICSVAVSKNQWSKKISDKKYIKEAKRRNLSCGIEIKKQLKTQVSDQGNFLAKSVQNELNRLGCNVGTVDGIIGPKSLEGLAQFTKLNSQEYTPELFNDPTFLKNVKKVKTDFCKANKVSEVTENEVFDEGRFYDPFRRDKTFTERALCVGWWVTAVALGTSAGCVP